MQRVEAKLNMAPGEPPILLYLTEKPLETWVTMDCEEAILLVEKLENLIKECSSD